MNALKIEGAVALVTGASRGLGYALTQELLDRGIAKVYAAAAILDAVEDIYPDAFAESFAAMEL